MFFRIFAAEWILAVGSVLRRSAFLPETGQFQYIRKHRKQPILWAALLCVCIRQAGCKVDMVGSPFFMPSSF